MRATRLISIAAAAGPGVVVDADRTGGRTAPGLSVYHTDRDTAVAAAFAACIVIDGHDPLRLLNDCYQALPPGDLRSRVLGCLLNTPPGERHPVTARDAVRAARGATGE